MDFFTQKQVKLPFFKKNPLFWFIHHRLILRDILWLQSLTLYYFIHSLIFWFISSDTANILCATQCARCQGPRDNWHPASDSLELPVRVKSQIGSSSAQPSSMATLHLGDGALQSSLSLSPYSHSSPCWTLCQVVLPISKSKGCKVRFSWDEIWHCLLLAVWPWHILRRVLPLSSSVKQRW